MNAGKRVAVGMFLTECNHLGGPSLDLAAFERSGLFVGDEMLRQALPPVLMGMIETLRGAGVTIVPLAKAECFCGGPITSKCYAHIRREMLGQLAAAGRVDGVLLALHGSATVDDVGDPEGDLLAAVRQHIGQATPIVATLDCHAHVTEAMVRHADALTAWRTYPHIDTLETGQRGARLLLDIMAGLLRPAMALAKAPVLVSGVLGQTDGNGPFADIMRAALALEGHDGVVSADAFLVHPYLDLPDMGGGALVITNGDAASARRHAEALSLEYWKRRFDLDPPVFKPADAIARGMAIDGGPILLVETADCIGGGAAGDSVATLKALLSAVPDVTSIVPVVDPSAAQACHRAGPGASVSLRLGHTLDPKWGSPITVHGVVERLHDGRFHYTGGYLAGTERTMGSSAVLRVGAIRVLIMSIPTYDWADEQFRAVGLDPVEAKFVVVKNPMNYRFGYRDIAKADFILDTPGPTPATLHHVHHQRLQRPYYPADKDIADFQPVVYCHQS